MPRDCSLMSLASALACFLCAGFYCLIARGHHVRRYKPVLRQRRVTHFPWREAHCFCVVMPGFIFHLFFFRSLVLVLFLPCQYRSLVKSDLASNRRTITPDASLFSGQQSKLASIVFNFESPHCACIVTSSDEF